MYSTYVGVFHLHWTNPTLSSFSHFSCVITQPVESNCWNLLYLTMIIKLHVCQHLTNWKSTLLSTIVKMLGYMCAIALCLVSQENAKGSKASFHNNKKRYVLYNIYIYILMWLILMKMKFWVIYVLLLLVYIFSLPGECHRNSIAFCHNSKKIHAPLKPKTNRVHMFWSGKEIRHKHKF